MSDQNGRTHPTDSARLRGRAPKRVNREIKGLSGSCLDILHHKKALWTFDCGASHRSCPGSQVSRTTWGVYAQQCMSRKRTAEIVASVIQAFLEDPTWAQAELARRAGTSSETLRKTLEDMSSVGWPFERDEEPPQVYWSLPRGYLPPGIVLPMERVASALRLLARLPTEGERDALLGFLSNASPASVHPSFEAWVQPELSRAEERWLGRIEDAIRDHQALVVRYYSAHRGALESRTISFQRITHDKHVRLCGHCHRADRLKWFRLNNVAEVETVADKDYVQHSKEEIDTFLDHSFLGYHADADADAAPSLFFVRLPEARWVQNNLPPAMTGELQQDGLRVTVRDVSIAQVARYVLYLADAARPDTDGLRQEVCRLARAALTACDLEDPAASTERLESHDT